MKTIRTFGLILGLMNVLISQEYLPLPEANSKWINTYSTLEWVPYPHMVINSVVNYCAPGIDTTIYGNSYFIIDTCENGGYKGALRNENGRVWFLPKNSPTEFLLYDFTAQSGDTIYDVYFETFGGNYELYDLYVKPSAVDSILINEVYRKRISFDAGYWIEGIGNTQGLFLEPLPNISEYMVDLYCMSSNDTTFYPEFSVGECEFPVGIKEMENNSLMLSIYPNPSTAEFFVDLKKSNWKFDLKNICVLNSFGQQINPVCQIENNIITLDMESFPIGIYFIRLTNKDIVITQKLIKE